MQEVHYCIYLYQYTTLQANHNWVQNNDIDPKTVFIYINIQLCKQTTTNAFAHKHLIYCIYLYQYTTLQANHNRASWCMKRKKTVFIYINIQLCKQTTTTFCLRRRASQLYLSISIYNFASKPQLVVVIYLKIKNCIYLYQYTTLQANHNLLLSITDRRQTVFIYINIQLCKQTTTFIIPQGFLFYCIYLYQYTTLQANHNSFCPFFLYEKLYLSISIYNFASKPQQ